jgi:predicted P-loop ATPase
MKDSMPLISIYKNARDVTSQDKIDLDIFLELVQSGKWQDDVLRIRTIQDKKERGLLKETMQNVTISGVFTHRRDKDCKAHSGFIAIDFDGLDRETESVKKLLSTDPYVYSCFVSISGNGLCALVKIDGEKHREAYEAIAEYFLTKHQLVTDPQCINISRARFVSYDPYLYLNENSLKWKKYLLKQKKRKIQQTIFVKTEFDEVIRQMLHANVSCVEDYRDWISVCFGLADQFGESGRDYFHKLSSCSSKYEYSICDKQYDLALNRKGKVSNPITIATIYWFAKQAGINVYSERTKRIAAATSTMKKSGLDTKTIAKNLQQFEGVEGQEAEDIIQQAFAAGTSFETNESIVENVRMWLRHNYNLKRNLITRKIENNGTVLEEIDFNQMFLDCKVLFDKLDFNLFIKVVFSHHTPSYNPVKEALESYEWDGVKRLDVFGGCINSNTGTLAWRCRMVQKWIVGIVHSVYGGYSELNFVLAGAKNTGKTEFFRKLLPKELEPYFAMSQLNRGKDDEILMCEKLIIMNDEYGGKNKPDSKNEKRLMASDKFDLRKPYGKGNETINRIASLCGTSNPTDVLNDPDGNRRIIVMEATGQFYFDLYNSVDKRQLFAETLQDWKQGERPVLTVEEIAILEDFTDDKFQMVSFEREMIQKYFEVPGKALKHDFMMSTEIKNHLEGFTKERINVTKLGGQLKKLGYERIINGKVYGYKIKKIDPMAFFVSKVVTENEVVTEENPF